MKKIYFLLIILSVCLISVSCKKNDDTRLKLIGSNFPCYDFLRAVSKDVEGVDVSMLLPPGVDMHSFEVTPSDIIDIDKSSLFVYIGGESEEYITDILSDLKKDEKNILKLFDYVTKEKERLKEGMEGEEEEEYDEHIWTSLSNAIKMVEMVKEKLISIDEKNKEKYIENANKYIEEIIFLDQNIKDVLNTSSRKTLIFADRFPLQYFAHEYNLDYYAAFKGCSESTEASSKTISFLIDKIKENNVNVIFKLELSSGNIASTISKATDSKILTFNSMHNISKEDFDSEKTYITIMKENISNLKEALK